MNNTNLRLRRFGRVLLGVTCGFLTYIPILVLTERLIYGRIDFERVFYGLYWAFGLSFLMIPSNWHYIQTDELVLNFIGAVLLISGGVVGYRLRNRIPNKGSS